MKLPKFFEIHVYFWINLYINLDEGTKKRIQRDIAFQIISKGKFLANKHSEKTFIVLQKNP